MIFDVTKKRRDELHTQLEDAKDRRSLHWQQYLIDRGLEELGKTARNPNALAEYKAADDEVRQLEHVFAGLDLAHRLLEGEWLDAVRNDPTHPECAVANTAFTAYQRQHGAFFEQHKTAKEPA